MEVTEETTDEGEQDYFYIHWIDVAATDNKEAGDAIKGRMEKWLRRIWK
jgi:multicomponent Na+:H+ antiporter subunit E